MLGPSGSGKTTLIRAIVGVQRAHTSLLSTDLLVDLAVITGAGVAALALGAATLRRRTA